MKKFIIGGAIVGAICPILGVLSPNAPIPDNLVTVYWVLFPFGFFTMDIINNPAFLWQTYILASILNVGLYAFLGYVVGTITQAIKRR